MSVLRYELDTDSTSVAVFFCKTGETGFIIRSKEGFLHNLIF